MHFSAWSAVYDSEPPLKPSPLTSCGYERTPLPCWCLQNHKGCTCRAPVRYVTKTWSADLLNKTAKILLSQMCCLLEVVKTRTITSNNSVFVSLLYMFRASKCPSSGENYCICATLICVTLYELCLVCWLDFNPTSRPDATHTEWQIPVSHRYSNFLLMLGTWMPETCREEK